MGDSKQEDLERFVMEDVGMQIANLRYHLASTLKEADGREPTISKEGYRMIDALLERLLSRVQSLKINTPPESANTPPESAIVCLGLAEGTEVQFSGESLCNPADDHGIDSVLGLLDRT